MYRLLGIIIIVIGLLFAGLMILGNQPQPLIGIGVFVAVAGGYPCLLYDAWVTGELRGKWGSVVRRESSPELFNLFFILSCAVCLFLLGFVVWVFFLGPAGLVPPVDLKKAFEKKRQRAEGFEGMTFGGVRLVSYPSCLCPAT